MLSICSRIDCAISEVILLNLDSLVPILNQSHLLLYNVELSGYESGKRFGRPTLRYYLKCLNLLMSDFDA